MKTLVERVLRRPPRMGRSRIIAIDGPSGAGKTTYAEGLADALASAGATVETVHTDDLLDGWEDQFTFWARLVDGVIAPVRRGEPGSYRPYDWAGQRFAASPVTVSPADVVIIEGVSAARAAMRSWADLTIFISCDDDVAWARLTERDDPALMGPLRRWKEREAAFFATDATADHVDLLIDGADANRITS